MTESSGDPYAPPPPGSTPAPSQPPPPPAGGYGGPGYGGRVVAARNGMGTAALVLGILAILTCWTVIGGIIFGLLGLIFGFIGRGRYRRREATNGGAATAGIVTGAIGLVVAIVFIIAGAVFFVHHKQDFQNLRDCLANAQTQQDRDQCNQQFSNAVNGG